MAELLAAASPIPIAQLTPDLSAPSTRCIRAIVTLIWPYSSSTSTLKVLLAEPDFRLRRTKGQVRIQFSGSSATSVFEAGIGSGDEVILILDGVDWIKDESAGQTPGHSIDWELKFSERLVLKIQQKESDKTSLLDIDHPIPAPQPEVVPDISDPEPLPSSLKSTAHDSGRPRLLRTETNEWSSPAFVKRARVSYGSLFGSDYDIFAEDDGTVQGKGRKRARFSRKSGAWRYSSHSQSPEPSQADGDMLDSGVLERTEEEKPAMTDEGCQTLGLEDNNAAEALADPSKQEGAAEDNPIIPESKLGTRHLGVTVLTEDPNRSEIPTDMPPSPRADIVLQDGDHEEVAKQWALSHPVEKALGLTQMDSNSSRAISLIPPIESSDSSSDVAAHPSSTVDAVDLYGLSPTADGYPRSVAPRADVSQTRSEHDAVRLPSEIDHDENPHQSEDHQTLISYPKLPSRSTSPDKSFGSTLQIYPEPDMSISHNFAIHNGPYYGEQFQNYPDIDDELPNQPSEGQWDMHPEDVRSPSRIPLVEHQMPHDVSMQKLLARHLSPGGVAMSRSQSGHSEMIDLTEDSDEGEGRLLEGSQTDNEEERNEQFYRKEQIDDQPGDEEERYEILLYDKNGSESGGSEVEFDEDNITHPPRSHPVKYLAPGEVADDSEDIEDEFDEDELDGNGFEEEDIEEEGSYEDESASDDEDTSTAAKRRSRGEPEVIDLLSSDEEDGEDGEDEEEDDASGYPSEAGEGHATALNEGKSMSVGWVDSDLEAESDVEDSEEMMEDLRAKNYLNERRLIGPTTLEKSEEISEESASEVGETKRPVDIHGNLSDGEDATGSFRGDQHETSKQTSHRGYDGASDTLDQMSVAPDEAGEETTTNVNEAVTSSSRDIIYPVLPIVKEDHPLPKNNIEQENASEISKNNQLPTPDSTQLSAVIAPETSFGSVDSFQASFDTKYFANDIVSHTQNSLQCQPTEGVEQSSMEAVDRFVTDPAKNSERDGFAVVTVDAVEESTKDLATTEATLSDGPVQMDIHTEITLEVIEEKAPSATSDVVIEDVKDALTEATRPSPVTPRRSKRLSFSQHRRERIERSQPSNMDEPTTPDDYDASVELATAALDSPSKQNPNDQPISDQQLRIMLSRPLRSNLGDFTTLKLIRFNLDKKLDVLAIVTTLPPEPQRAKQGLRHYHLRFNITDATVASSGAISVNIFRPYKTALPVVQVGEVILLRNFLVKSEKGAGFTLRSDDGSSWVVFKHGGEEEAKGPPVEYGDEERDHVVYLKTWYRILESSSRERLEKAIGDKPSGMGRTMAKVF